MQLLDRQFDPRQVFVAGVLGELGERRLEGLRELAFDRLARSVVVAVIGDAVDEEQAQHFHAAAAKLKLLLQVLLDGVLDLHPPDVLAHPADFIAQPHDAAVGEADEFVARLGVDLGDLEAVAVAGPLIRQAEEVGSVLDRDRFLLRPLGRLDVDADFRLDARLVVDLLDADEGVVGSALGGRAGDDDLLDQPKLEGPHRVETVDQVVRVAVRGGISQRAKWVECLDRLPAAPCSRRIDALRLVDDDDGPGRLHELDGLPAGEFVAFLVDDVALLLRLGAGEILAEGVDVDDAGFAACC